MVASILPLNQLLFWIQLTKKTWQTYSLPMTEYFELPEVPEYISTDQAAKILGISKQRVYQFIEEKRLPAFRAGNVILLKEEVVKQFKPNITGRPRKKGPLWRVYRGGIAVIGKDIQVEVRDGQEERLKEKLYTIYQEQRHIFPGTIQRYIFKDKSFPTVVSILLIWKDTDMPTRQRCCANQYKRGYHLYVMQACERACKEGADGR